MELNRESITNIISDIVNGCDNISNYDERLKAISTLLREYFDDKAFQEAVSESNKRKA